jgi:hypothetical protein
MTIQIVGPHHRSASAVGPIHDSFSWNVNPLAIDAYAIVTVLAFPICIVDALCLTAIAAGTLATVQGLIPTVQLRVIMIMSMSATDCEDRQGSSSSSKNHHRVPIFSHLTSNSCCVRIRHPGQAGLSAKLSKSRALTRTRCRENMLKIGARLRQTMICRSSCITLSGAERRFKKPTCETSRAPFWKISPEGKNKAAPTRGLTRR